MNRECSDNYVDMLFIEDSPVLGKMLTMRFEIMTEGVVQCHSRGTLEDAFLFLLDHEAAAIVLDLNLETSKGADTLKEVEGFLARQNMTDVPVIIFTGSTNETVLRQVRQRRPVFIKGDDAELNGLTEAVYQALGTHLKKATKGLTNDDITLAELNVRLGA